MNTHFIFCPRCATRLEMRSAGHAERPTCPVCGFIHFPDPKVAVIALISCAEQILLTRRGVDPERGKWSLPGGYMDAGEMPVAALRRELHEEVDLALADVHFDSFLPMSGGRGVVIVFTATPASGRCDPLVGHDDVAEARWFGAQSLPMPENLAFATTSMLLDGWREREISIGNYQAAPP